MTEAPAFDWRRFEEFSAAEAYALLQLRSDVFVLEQACFYRDIDGRDFEARHLRALLDGRPVAALRLFPAGTETPARLGRVVVAKPFRGRGYARLIVAEALAEHRRLSGDVGIELSAQHHLERFYAGFGFRSMSEPYEEDGIPHVDMRRTAS